MPLSEFLKMARGKLQPGPQRPSPLGPSSSRVDDDLVELVWENGQIMMQGQSSRATRSSILDNLLSTNPRTRDAGIGHMINSRSGKFGVVESILNDLSPIVPSGDYDLSQDDEMAPWLTYPVGDALPHDYCSDLLPEISGVTANGMSAQSNFLSAEKRSSCDQIVSTFRSEGNPLKIDSAKSGLPSTWLPQQVQMSDPSLGSGVSGVSNSKHPEALYPARDMSIDPTSMKTERQNIRMLPSNNNSNLLNFSCFSRPATLVKPNLPNNDPVPPSIEKRLDVEEKRAASSCNNNPIKEKGSNAIASSGMFEAVTSRAPATKPKDSFPAEKNENLFRQTSFKNEKPLVVANAASVAKVVQEGERGAEPMVASSSVGSGNSADRGSYDNAHNSKRKFCDLDESECRSHDIETESAGTKKVAPAGGGTGAKRSRAAEVHNLSERRRRDRINEKMRALQELIPNCNKADKASMLDEAIEYLKTLQLQVQIMSMGAGLCMPPMMFPPGLQHMHPAHVPHFSPMGVGMGMGMGYGMGMVDMNGGSMLPVPPMQGPHFPSPMNFQRIPASNLQLYGHPAQGLPNSMPRPPLVPSSAPQSSVAVATGLSPTNIVSQDEIHTARLALNSEDPNLTNKSSHIMHNPEAGSTINPTSDQVLATNEALDQSALGQEKKQTTDVVSAPITSSTATDISKETG